MAKPVKHRKSAITTTKRNFLVYIGPIRRAGIVKVAQWLNNNFKLDDYSEFIENKIAQNEKMSIRTPKCVEMANGVEASKETPEFVPKGNR